MTFDLTKCTVCPRECGTDRTKSAGICGAGSAMRVAKIMLHRWEEPCISGNGRERGSGAVFFGGCPLKCVFCQNKAISRSTYGMKDYSPRRLADVLKKLEEEGAYNINFVSPTQYIPQIIETLDLYRPSIPVIFNTGGYEKRETVAALRGYADIFLTDFKYGTAQTAKKYSNAPDYHEQAREALAEMVSVTGGPLFDENGMMKRGVIVRHLIIPGERHDSMEALRLVSETVSPGDVVISLMSQYTPDFAPENMKNLRRRVTTFEYETVREYALSLGFSGYSQDTSSARKTYTPDF